MPKKYRRIGFVVMSVSLLSITLVAAALTYTDYQSIVSAYEKKYNDMTLLCNRVVAANISGDDISRYIDFLKNNEAIKIKQQEYDEFRKQIYILEENGVPQDSEEIKERQKKMAVFKNDMQQYKDEDYYTIQKTLNELRDTSGAKYLYILADTGVPDAYTYIFDAHTAEDVENIDVDDFGTVDSMEALEDVAKVLESGKQMDKAVFYQNGIFGSLNFAYAPIKDTDGKTVAVVGTDMDLSEMSRELANVLTKNIVIWVLIAVLALGFTYWLLRKIITIPIRKLGEIGQEITGGKVYTEIPDRLCSRKDEIGQIANTFQSVITSFQGVISKSNELLENAMNGRLTVRSDPSLFEGDYAHLLSQFNATLDIVEQYSDNIPAAILIIDLDLIPLYQNRSYFEIITENITVAELVSALIGEESVGSIDDLKAKLYELVQNGDFSTVIRMPGTTAQRSMSVVCRKWEVGNNPKGFLLISRDITELMLEKEKALNASKAKSDFLSRVSHELRTPLNTIVGMTQLGLKDKNITDESTKRLINISNASKHLLCIINDVLDMAKVEAGKAELNIEQFDIVDLMAELEELVSIHATNRGLELIIAVDSKVPRRLMGDGGRLKQILLNLAGNAVKFTESGGKIFLNVSVEEQSESKASLRFRMADTGVGMSPEFLNKIFTPFEQEDQYIKRRYKGTGLGLSISFGFVTLMGGTIDVKSELGKGSEFIVILPFDISEKEQSNETVVRREEPQSFNLYEDVKILLVDDIDINREILKEILKLSFDLEITESVDGIDALEKFKASKVGEFSMIFMDIQMPYMDGYDCTREIRKLNRPDAPEIPIVALTANAFKEDQDAAMAAGMNDYLVKPVDIAQCMQIVKRYCGN